VRTSEANSLLPAWHICVAVRTNHVGRTERTIESRRLRKHDLDGQMLPTRCPFRHRRDATACSAIIENRCALLPSTRRFFRFVETERRLYVLVLVASRLSVGRPKRPPTSPSPEKTDVPPRGHLYQFHLRHLSQPLATHLLPPPAVSY